MLTKSITWDESLKIGNEKIDNQHKHLFESFEKFRVAAQKGSKEVAAGNCLGEMARYIEAHFASEEEYMRSIDYPGLAAQMDKHREFTGKVNGYVTCCSFGYVPYEDMLEYLVTWLTEHIMVEDRRIGS